MKTFENMAIRRKLASFRSVFPHDDNTTVKNLGGIYDDVLEFSRPGQYSESVTRAAWKLLLLQIGQGTMSPLLQAISKRPPVEMKSFLSALMTTCMSDVEELNDSLNQKAMLSPSSKEVLVLATVLDFIARISTQSESACQTVLDAGILDMLLRIYVVFSTLSDATPQDVDYKDTLRGACRLNIVVLGQSPQHQGTVFNHPVCILWTDCHSQPPGYAIEAPVEDRCAAWRRVSRSYVQRRVIAIYRGSLRKPNNDTVRNIEVCADIVDFTNHQFYDSEIVDLGFLTILRQIVLRGSSAQHLIRIFGRSSHDDTVRIFSGIIHLWLECIEMQVKNDVEARAHRQANIFSVVEQRSVSGSIPKFEIVHKTFYSREKSRIFAQILNLDTALYNVIEFAAATAKRNANVRLGMLDAGCLALVLTAFANADFRLSSLTDAPRMDGKAKGAKPGHRENSGAETLPPYSLTAINAEASTLSVFIHTPKFNKLWQGQRLDTRLSLCSSLVYSLLGRDEVDEGYEVTRALFRKIVAVDP